MTKFTGEDYNKIINIAREYLTVEAGFNSEQRTIAAMFITDFLLVGNEKDWPLFDEDLPEILRAIAIILEEWNRLDKQRHPG